jgi:hypothetical protein
MILPKCVSVFSIVSSIDNCNASRFLPQAWLIVVQYGLLQREFFQLVTYHQNQNFYSKAANSNSITRTAGLRDTRHHTKLYMVQPAYKRRAIDDSPESDFQQLEGLEIIQADKEVAVPDSHCVHEQNGSQLPGFQTTKAAEISTETKITVTVSKVEMDLQTNSQPLAVQDNISEPPKTPQRQLSSQPPTTPRSQRTLRMASDFSNRSEPQKSPTPEEEVKPRMVMTRMVLNNFKSYAGRQNIGPFHKVRQSTCGIK